MCTSDQLTAITSRSDNAEIKIQRSNLQFFGLEDESNDDWAMSEQKIINFCSEKVGDDHY